jgi:hypothetical protein
MKIVEKIKTDVLCSVTFFPPENRAVYEIMSKNTVKPERKKTMWRLCVTLHKESSTCPLSCARAHTHTRALSLSHSHTHTRALSHSHTHTLSLTHTHTLSLTHSHTHTRVLTHTHTHSLSHSHTLSLSLTHTHTHTLCLSHSHTHTLPHSLTHTHTRALSHSLTHTHTHTEMCNTDCFPRQHWFREGASLLRGLTGLGFMIVSFHSLLAEEFQR